VEEKHYRVFLRHPLVLISINHPPTLGEREKMT
jgi:hypothetical protein